MGEWQVRAAYFKTKRRLWRKKEQNIILEKLSKCRLVVGMRLHRRRADLWLRGACGGTPALKRVDFYASGDHTGEVEDILLGGGGSAVMRAYMSDRAPRCFETRRLL